MPENPSSRNFRHGVVLISTLISLILVISLTLLLQSVALANTKVIKRLTRAEQRSTLENAVRELSRPLFAEAILDFNGSPRLKLNSTPYTINFEGVTFNLVAQDVNGLVSVHKTSEAAFGEILPPTLAATVIRMRQDHRTQLPFRQRFIIAGGDIDEFPVPEKWITDQSQLPFPNAHNLPAYYIPEINERTFPEIGEQPTIILLSIN